MATSRYAVSQQPVDRTTTASQNQNQQQVTQGTSNQSVTANSSSNTSETGRSTTRENRTTTNMDPQSLAALQALIAQLMGGGTPEMAAQRAIRNQEIRELQSQREGYSKESAFADAQGAMSQAMRRTMESLVPSITRAAEGAGTSANSMRALLLQDAATRAADAASALGLNAATAYGGVSNQMSGILETLTRSDDTVTTALMNALNIAKGAVQTTTGTSTTDSSRNSSTVGSQTQNTIGSTSQTTNTNTNNNAVQTIEGGSGSSQQNRGFVSSGPTVSDADIAYAQAMARPSFQATEADILRSLVSGAGSWSNYGTF